ncbi:MAG: AAA family ATPase [Clostridia bacterium]|nr:AAA family ATPase [Clostridia bacterium]
MNKSKLCEFCYKLTHTVSEELGVRGITANIFTLAALRLYNDAKCGALPKEITETLGDELEELGRVLSRYGVDVPKAMAGLKKCITDGNKISGFLDVYNFNTLPDKIAKDLEYGEDDELTLPVFIKYIFANPTDAIKDTALSSATEGDGSSDDELERKKREALKAIEEMSKWASGIVEENGGEGAEPAATEETADEQADKLTVALLETQRIRDALFKNVFGQDGAINAFATGYFRSLLTAHGKKRSKPSASFLFAGPPGTGKTFISETVAEALGRPFKRFDMSEYSDHQTGPSAFIGTPKGYTATRPGIVTGFVHDNPNAVILFDEIEKAHLNVIHLFLQILDAGRLRDAHYEEEIDFTDTIIILTTNAGRSLYEDNASTTLSSIPKKTVIKALGEDINPNTRAPLFPQAILSRFASGNVVMFNHLAANHLYTIARRELEKNVELIEGQSDLKITVDDRVATALLLAEGGSADARAVCGRANTFFSEELFELLRLVNQDTEESVVKLKEIDVSIDFSGASKEASDLIVNESAPEILVFASPKTVEFCKEKITNAVVYSANTIAKAKDILFKHDISVVLCDIFYKSKKRDADSRLNAEDVISLGRDFMNVAIDSYDKAVYVLAEGNEISDEEEYSFTARGARGVIALDSDNFCEKVLSACDIAYKQEGMKKLARENKILTYKTYQKLNRNGTRASITVFDMSLKISATSTDSRYILDGVSKPKVRFDDVIGAKDAKGELGYFVEYLKNPTKYMRMGVRAPRGVLLYGPPGTGKTMLAKAVAGESDVTFIAAEGNQFVDSLVGEGAKKIHEIFKTARRYAPSILFIDEIDSIAKSRMDSSSSSSNTLNALLTELDGFNVDTSRPVFVLAATNFGVEAGGEAPALDAALMRRFDRRIYIDLPTKDERRLYLEKKLSGNSMISLSEEQIASIAERSVGMSLASLESVIELAMRNAIKSRTGKVGDEEFDEAFETFGYGEKKEWDPSELTRTARHEAGHALLAWLSGEKPSYLTVVARGNHGGYLQHESDEKKGSYTKEELLWIIRTSLAGRAAELVYYGEEGGLSTGPSADLRHASQLAENMLTYYGMYEDFGLCSLKTGPFIEGDMRGKVNSILGGELERTKRIIEDNRAAIDALVSVLVDKNQLRAKEIDAILSAHAKK